METDSKQSTGANAMPWLDEFKKLIEKFQLPGIDLTAMAEWQRKDMEALSEANRQAYEGIKVLLERRNEILKETLAEWQSAITDVANTDAMSKQAEAAKLGVEKAVANFRELSQMEAQTRNDAWKVLQERMRENLGNLQKLLQPK